MKILILGAGGPVARAAVEALAPHHTLRLGDLNAVESPHESLAVDVTDRAQVESAAAGMDALVNCTVNRNDPALAFAVNTRGAYNLMRAAQRAGIRRVVQTGPFLVGHGYHNDFGITEACPPRTHTQLYALSKYLGQEICRAFAYEHSIEVACLLFCTFANPEDTPMAMGAFTVSWRDAGEAIRRAVEVERLPEPFEVLHILGDVPMGKYRNDKARAVLGWEPQDDFESWWRRDGPEPRLPRRMV